MTSADRSPFPYQGPLRPDQVSGRDDVARELSTRLADRRLTALLGPRRFGKTSLLRKVGADAEAAGHTVVWIDLYELASMADLAGAIDAGLADVRGGARRALDLVAGTLELRLGAVRVSLSQRKRDRPDPTDVVRRLVKVITDTARRERLLVIFDEFSGIARVEGGAGHLRTGLQHHYQDLAIIFAGSQPSTMRLLFADQRQPFFAQADLIELGPLADGAALQAIQAGFAATGRDAGEAAAALVAFAAGHPQRAMQLADALWRLTPRGSSASAESWVLALEGVRAGVDLESAALFPTLPAGSQRVLRVLAHGQSVYGAAAQLIDLPPGTAQAALETLAGDGYVARRDGANVIIDPMLADWLRRRYPSS